MGDEAPSLILDEDVPCEQCGFNLRGLPTRYRCPECGEAYEVSTLYDEVDSQARALGLKIGAYADAISVVLEAHVGAVHAKRNDDWWMRQHAAAVDVCRDLRHAAKWFFRVDAEAAWTFAAWGLNRSEDVGRIVFALADAGMLAVRPEDRPSDFDGLFTLDDFFVRPHPKLDAPPA